jgi:hypothetical protein
MSENADTKQFKYTYNIYFHKVEGDGYSRRVKLQSTVRDHEMVRRFAENALCRPGDHKAVIDCQKQGERSVHLFAVYSQAALVSEYLRREEKNKNKQSVTEDSIESED